MTYTTEQKHGGWMTMENGQDFCWSVEQADAERIAIVLNNEPELAKRFFDMSEDEFTQRFMQ